MFTCGFEKTSGSFQDSWGSEGGKRHDRQVTWNVADTPEKTAEYMRRRHKDGKHVSYAFGSEPASAYKPESHEDHVNHLKSKWGMTRISIHTLKEVKDEKPKKKDKK